PLSSLCPYTTLFRSSIKIIGMQFLDFFDFLSNSILMPIVAFLTCILIGHVVGTKVIADEVKQGGAAFHREKLHRVMIRWVAPVRSDEHTSELQSRFE